MKKRTGIITLLVTLAVLIFAGFVMFGQDKRLEPFGDVRGKSLQKLDLQGCEDVLRTQRFDSRTRWPAELPAGFDPTKIMKMGKDPGLGLSGLHARGITGKGVGVAIIDGPLRLDHVEYKDRIAYYRPPRGFMRFKQPVYHASMVTSVLAGKTTGVAPECMVYYFGGDLNRFDAIPTIIREIIKFNRSLPKHDKIRVISVSAGSTLPDWTEAQKEAAEEGITVVTTAELLYGLKTGGIQCPLGKDRDDPANYRLSYFQQMLGLENKPGDICIPIDNRTFADYQSREGYIFNPRGGMSEGAPYLAGVIALGYQVNPNLTPEEIETLLCQSATPFGEAVIVNPAGFVELARQEAGGSGLPIERRSCSPRTIESSRIIA